MLLARLAAAAILTAFPSAPGAWGQDGVENANQESKKLGAAGANEKSVDADTAAALKKKFLICKKTGDCKPYLLEKEMARNKLDPEKPSAGEPPAPLEEAVPPGSPPGEEGAASVPLGATPPAAPPPTAEQAEAAREAAATRGERTMRRASGAAETLRRSLPSAEEAAEAGADGPERRAAPAPPGSVPENRSGPAEPRTVAEMALAARSGFAATFRDQGLKVGAGPRGEPAIQRADGTPATAPELERLSAALSAEPAALIRRPDFFQVLPRQKFADLKRDFAESPALRAAAFKDIGMTGRGRDFQWSASCSGLSGVCNPSAGAGSYRKGQDVPPEDLKEVWKAAHEETGEAEEEFGEYSDEDRRLAEAEDLAAEKLGTGRRLPKNLGALLARMGDMARSLGGSDGQGENASPDNARMLAGAEATAPGDRPRAQGSRSDAPKANRFDSPQAKEARFDSPRAKEAPFDSPQANRGRFWLYALAAAAVVLILKGLRRAS